jgi:hypothetical protein
VPVVADHDERPSAVVEDDVDMPRTRVDRVLDQLLDGCGRAFDDLARRDAVDDRLRQPANGDRPAFDFGSRWV